LTECEQGTLYESLALPGQNRKQIKRRVLVDVMYGDGSYPSPVRDRFRELYPAEYRVLAELKAVDYQRASWILQNRESRMFIATIGQRIMTERPGVPLFGIHDAIGTTSEHADYVEAVAMDEFSRLEVTPTFTRETYV